MKYLLSLLPLLLLGITLTAQNPVRDFYREHKRQEDVQNFTIPGWLIGLGAGIARPFVDEPEAKVALKFAKKINKTRLLIAEEGNPIPPEVVEDFVQKIRQADFEDLVYVRDEDVHVNIMVRDKNEKIKEMVILVSEPESLVFLGMKTNFRYEDISRLVSEILRAEREDEPASPAPEEPVVEPEPAMKPRV